MTKVQRKNAKRSIKNVRNGDFYGTRNAKMDTVHLGVAYADQKSPIAKAMA